MDPGTPPVRFLPRNLTEALDRDCAFLQRGSILSDELRAQRLPLNQQEIRSIETMPHPFESKLYFNL